MKARLAIAVCLWKAGAAAALAAAPSGGDHGPGSSFAAWAQANVHPAVARIVAPSAGSISYGSGTLVHADERLGVVITNWHVVNEATGPISVHFPDGFYSLGTLHNVDRDWDLAAIVIRKPNAAPVALASEAPRPGEILTIAGYGSGQYRAASGPCTQYVAPGLQFPFEMVELAASARQGDSGGPIFNSRGELAGVLFGEGHGRTSGSYCGRVRWFLTSVVPRMREPVAIASVTPLEPVPLRPQDVGPEARPRQTDMAQGSPHASAATAGMHAQSDRVAASPAEKVAPVASTRSGEPQIEAVPIRWEDIAGETLGEQAKTVLAVIGVLAILLHALRWLSREPAGSK